MWSGFQDHPKPIPHARGRFLDEYLVVYIQCWQFPGYITPCHLEVSVGLSHADFTISQGSPPVLVHLEMRKGDWDTIQHLKQVI